MVSYPKLPDLMASFDPAVGFDQDIVPYLVDVWLDEYFGKNPVAANVVETKDGGFAYLFDLGPQRLIAAWGVSAGRSAVPRAVADARLKGHPLNTVQNGVRYNRGHAIAHILGGSCDINIVPQRGGVNVGVFRILEGQAAANPGSLYFTYWEYNDPKTQTPSYGNQGLLIPGRAPRFDRRQN